ncbi:MbnP family protein [Hymenobacter negativus]|uniref:Copper-binding protein MbnP-like domain-containing protein n=1 Tax=Hymenobacter negativus TaxID=2795026 RepID=A0ABS3Q859_9BACT|nr:MbnP family protein [Hymenobacter negativus]MBO2007436.1 hypothetical protein [Hymenobacter negativus]
MKQATIVGLPFVLLTGLLFSSCKKDSAEPPAATVGTLTIDMENVVGSAPLVLDRSTYTSPAGEPFTVSCFNYYLSNFKLQRADGSEYAVPESYFLIRERPTGPNPDNGKHFVLDSIPAGNYTGISFLIGVDEDRNMTGAQTGALSPDNYMFWTWSQGYIFLQMEGNSSRSGEPGTHMLAYHVGDFRRPNNLRIVAPPLPSGGNIQVRQGHAPTLHLRADLLRLFAGPSPALTNSVLFGPFWMAVGGSQIVPIVNNYSGSTDRHVPGTNSMFTVAAIHND